MCWQRLTASRGLWIMAWNKAEIESPRTLASGWAPARVHYSDIDGRLSGR